MSYYIVGLGKRAVLLEQNRTKTWGRNSKDENLLRRLPKMTETGETYATSETREENNEKKLFPTVAMYGPCSVANLVKGDIKYWCACGLSKTQPWCDGSHKGTGFKPLKWTVSKSQTRFQICACKYTKDPPYCDATHTNLPCDILERQASCDMKQLHVRDCKLCTSCGWVPDF